MKTEERPRSLSGNHQKPNPASRAAGARERPDSGAADLPASGAELYRFPLCCAADEPALGNLLSLSFEPSSYSGVSDSLLPLPLSTGQVRVADGAADEEKPAPGETPLAPALEVLPAEAAATLGAPLFGHVAAKDHAGRNPWVLVLVAVLAVLAALILYYTLRCPADGAALRDLNPQYPVRDGQQGPWEADALGLQCGPALGGAESHGQA
mgnify:CR=1 FL=1